IALSSISSSGMLTLTDMGNMVSMVAVSCGLWEYRGLIGEKYESLEMLQIHDVTMSKDYGENLDVYIVSRAPGSSGPQIIFRKNLPIGTIVEVTRVLRCKNCLPSRIEFMVKISTEDLIPDIPVRLVNMISENQQTGEFTL